MKRITSFIITLLLVFGLYAQVKPINNSEQSLHVQTFRLSNGLKVILAEDHSEPQIYGAVIVHAGSKNEDSLATGVAHYFEHIMFKGTDRIGTTNWNKEKPILDAISDAYDQLQATKDEKERHEIQLEINRLNIEASKYAIANETDAILQQMGCTNLNAGTTYDYTIYYNTLPSNQLENWMEVYAERFRNPVYRLFQGELEAVYEERNIYANNPMYSFSRNIFTESFGEHPYSRDIIGLDEHLKNPQPSAMKKFYDKYYVASNMTLLLVGDFNPAQAKQMAEKYFTIWPAGKKVKEPNYNLPKFETKVIKNVKQTPIKAGLMVFPGVKNGDRDEIALNVMSLLLNGGNGTLDKLSTDGKLLAASLTQLSLKDAGSNVIIYIPKLLGQKHEEAEELIWECIDSMKTGGFDNELLDAIKMRLLVERKQQLESISGIAELLESLECTGSGYEQWLDDINKLKNLQKNDIMRVAKYYFDREHCTIIRSSMGFPAKDAAIKPDWDHLEAQNQGEQSSFAKKIYSQTVKEINPQVIDFQKDVIQLPINQAYRLYASPNPRNDLFSLTIAYHYGTVDNRDIDPATAYFNQLGAGNMDLQQYQLALDKLGASFSLSSDYDYTYMNISGPEANLESIMQLVMLKLHHPNHDEQQIKNLIEALQANESAVKNDASTWFDALREYITYGEQSNYINHTTIKEMKKFKGEELMNLINTIFTRDGYVTFVGNTAPEKIVNIIKTENLAHTAVSTVPIRIRLPRTIKENEVYYTSNKKFLKSDILLKIQSSNFDYMQDRAAAQMFNEYMGGGMNSIFFQEIREFRALGYSTNGRFNYDRQNRYRAQFVGYLGTQCDKTIDGITAMRDLMISFPQRKAKFLPAKNFLLSSRNSDYIHFRNIPNQVRYWHEVERLDTDPRNAITEEIKKIRFDDLIEFHQKYIADRPMQILITGNAKKYKAKELKNYGKVKQIKFKDLFRF